MSEELFSANGESANNKHSEGIDGIIYSTSSQLRCIEREYCWRDYALVHDVQPFICRRLAALGMVDSISLCNIVHG